MSVTQASELPDASRQRVRVWLRLLKVTKFVEQIVRENLRAEFDTTLPRFDVLAALYRFEEGLKMSELSAALRVSNGNVTGIIERLVSDGMVLRVPVEGDKRATLVRLTRKGHEEFSKMADGHTRWVNEILADLPPEDCEQVIAILDVVGRSHTQTVKVDDHE
jgi:DNA-binding MarR family transcriptional regulator